MTNLAGQEVSGYTLLHLLGQGGSADVYLSEHKHHQPCVAVKIHRTETTNTRGSRRSNEINMLSRLAHPHILRMHAYGTQNDLQFIVTDWAEQGTLFTLLAQELPISVVVSCVKQLASALRYLHSLHLVHRDVKPTNILIKQKGKFLLADFELTTDYRYCHSPVATPAYAAPEQTQGYPCPASDQYALGVLTYQWLCGELPFSGSCTEMVAQHRYASPPPLRDKVPLLSSAIEQVVLTALAKDPGLRFRNIQIFAEALAQACRSSSYWTPSQYWTPCQIQEFLGTAKGPETLDVR